MMLAFSPYVDKEQSWAPAFKYHAHEFDGRSLNALLEGSGSLLLVAGLTGLLGCQGVSTGASGRQQSQSGTLSLGVVSVDFGTVTLGSKQTLSETVTNSGGSSVTVSAIGISGSGFALNGVTTPVTLTAGQSTTLAFRLPHRPLEPRLGA